MRKEKMMGKRKLWVPSSERIRQEENDRPKVTCTAPIDLTKSHCPTCEGKIIVHCPECNQAVTSCACRLKERVTSIKDELIGRLFN